MGSRAESRMYHSSGLDPIHPVPGLGWLWDLKESGGGKGGGESAGGDKLNGRGVEIHFYSAPDTLSSSPAMDARRPPPAAP